MAGQQAGPLKNEIDWETIQQESGYPTPVHELTTVTQKVRRVARFDWDVARLAIDRNRPTRVAVMGFDYLDYADYRKTQVETLAQKSRQFLGYFESNIGHLDYIGTGPRLTDMTSGLTKSAADVLRKEGVVA